MGEHSKELLPLTAITYRSISVMTLASGLEEFIDLESTSTTTDFTSIFTLHDVINFRVCIQDNLIVSTNSLYSGCAGMCNLNGRKKVNLHTFVLYTFSICKSACRCICDCKIRNLVGNLKFVKSETPIQPP